MVRRTTASKHSSTKRATMANVRHPAQCRDEAATASGAVGGSATSAAPTSGSFSLASSSASLSSCAVVVKTTYRTKCRTTDHKSGDWWIACYAATTGEPPVKGMNLRDAEQTCLLESWTTVREVYRRREATVAESADTVATMIG